METLGALAPDLKADRATVTAGPSAPTSRSVPLSPSPGMTRGHEEVAPENSLGDDPVEYFHDDDEDEEYEELSSQSLFSKREGARRWSSYFRRAHQILNDIEEDHRDDSDSGGSDDAVRLYHGLYEVVNQVVGGVQLAFATGVSDGDASHEVVDDESASTQTAGPGMDAGVSAMSMAFMSAAVVLARLAQASLSTPLEYEDFGAQAGATMALACGPSRKGAPLSRDELRLCLQLLSGEGAELPPRWHEMLMDELLRSVAEGRAADLALFQRSWHMYAADLPQALWRSAEPPPPGRGGRHIGRSTLNPLDERLVRASGGHSQTWQLFPTYVVSKPLHAAFGSDHQPFPAAGGGSNHAREAACPACAELTRVVLAKYSQFDTEVRENSSSAGNESPGGGRSRRIRAGEVNNAFFAWQLTHEVEQGERGAEVWPELYNESKVFRELKHILKLTCLEYLHQVYDAAITELDLAQLELSIWASVTPPLQGPGEGGRMGLDFHDHPMALLSGVFYAQAGGQTPTERTPTVFADPRGTASFRYTGVRNQRGGDTAAGAGPRWHASDTLEPVAPFHRLAYAHAADGMALVFPSWLVHGVPPHAGREPRVVFAFNLHTLQGTTLSSWAKTSL